MAQNKGAIVRYRAIDRCLRSKHGKYGIEELRAACAEALYDAFSERMSVSRRQIYDDINHMESNAGYRAEIEHYRDGSLCRPGFLHRENTDLSGGDGPTQRDHPYTQPLQRNAAI